MTSESASCVGRQCKIRHGIHHNTKHVGSNIKNVDLSSYSGTRLLPWTMPRNLFACLIAMTSQQDIHGQWQLQAKIDHDPHSTWNIARSNLVTTVKTGHPQHLRGKLWGPKTCFTSSQAPKSYPLKIRGRQTGACVGSTKKHNQQQHKYQPTGPTS